jgi:predicted nucleic acid-binding protein
VNIVDSSAWLEYFGDGANAGYFAPAIQATGDLIVPTITLFEVFKRVYVQRGEGPALQAVALMQQGHVVDFDAPLALAAATLSADEKLPLADSVVLATARRFDATLWTQDSDFDGVPNVRFRRKQTRG